MMDNYDLDYFKNFVSPEALEEFLDPRIFSRDILLDDPIDFINGFNLALAFINKDEFINLTEEARFRIGLGIWLNRYINRIENHDWI
jgi:hypothetical protein|tara:strand:- start:838 stop:1098 length:261 start_codon:yes stop_codon:yes gene_type:complete